MKPRRIVDTNLILRYLVQDHRSHGEIAARLFAACDRGDLILIVLPEVVAECVFVLESFYQHAREHIAEAMIRLLSSPSIQTTGKSSCLEALRLYSASKLHYIDCTVAANAAAQGVPLATFDAKLKKLAGIVVDLDV